MANILASIESSTAGSSPVSFADVTSLSATVSVASTGSIIMLVASVPHVPGEDRVATYRFAVGGVREGPQVNIYLDNPGGEEGTDLAGFTYLLTGLSGSQTFSLQWETVDGKTTSLDTTKVRSFQIIEILPGDVGSLLASILSVTSGTAPATFADVPALSATVSIASVDSVVLMAGTVLMDPASSSDQVAEFRQTLAGAQVGPEVRVFHDNVDEGDSLHTVLWAETGLSGSQTFAQQWQEEQGSPTLDTSRERSFQVLELLAIVQGEATLTSTAAVAATGIAARAGVATLNATAAITAVGTVARAGAADLTSTAAITATGILNPGALNATLTGNALVAATGSVTKAGVATLNATAAVTATPTLTLGGDASLAAVCVLFPIPSIKDFAQAQLISFPNVLEGTGSLNPGVLNATLSSTAAITATASVIRRTDATLTGNAFVVATGETILRGVAALNADAIIAATGILNTGVLNAAISADAAVVAAGSVIRAGAALLDANAIITATGQDFDRASASLLATAILTPKGILNPGALVAALAADATIVAVGESLVLVISTENLEAEQVIDVELRGEVTNLELF